MKKINIIITLGALAVSLLLASCNSILEEQPRHIYEPGYFQTEKGVQGGLTSMYAHLRYIFGQGYFYNITLTGTDEYTWAASADGNFKDADMTSGGTMTPSTSRADVLWNEAFPNINTASGVIENAESVGLDPALIAEARFFRAFDYFMLVQTFGGVPLDLGSGDLQFNVTPSRVSKRNTVPEVYTIAIFPDLEQAVKDLPETPRLTGTVTKSTARLFLAKAYLTYAWWLENPNNIATYPESPRTDPKGRTAAQYYQLAYDVATEGIDNPGSFHKLQPTYRDVHLAQNDRNSEILLLADHTNNSQYYNGGIDFGYGNGEAPDNFACWMVTPQSENIRSSETLGGTYNFSTVRREAVQWGGRPWTRMATPIGVFTKTFADKTNDSRFDATFTSVFRGNWEKGGAANTVVYNANGMTVPRGGAILSFVDKATVDGTITYPSGAGNSNVGAAEVSGRADYVIAFEDINRQYYPGLWKIGTYRTDNGSGLGTPNGSTCRPFVIAKFSDLYLVAAEAAVKGATTKAGKSARELVNVLRARAGMWSFSNAENAAKVDNKSAEMIAATPNVIDINYILEERSREFFGEGHRWFDLVRTQKWAEIAGSYQIAEAGGHNVQTVTRTINAFHYLRPIPQAQIDRLEFDDAQKKAYQNPGY
jgi:SusD family.